MHKYEYYRAGEPRPDDTLSKFAFCFFNGLVPSIFAFNPKGFWDAGPPWDYLDVGSLIVSALIGLAVYILYRILERDDVLASLDPHGRLKNAMDEAMDLAWEHRPRIMSILPICIIAGIVVKIAIFHDSTALGVVMSALLWAYIWYAGLLVVYFIVVMRMLANR